MQLHLHYASYVCTIIIEPISRGLHFYFFYFFNQMKNMIVIKGLLRTSQVYDLDREI